MKKIQISILLLCSLFLANCGQKIRQETGNTNTGNTDIINDKDEERIKVNIESNNKDENIEEESHTITKDNDNERIVEDNYNLNNDEEIITKKEIEEMPMDNEKEKEEAEKIMKVINEVLE